MQLGLWLTEVPYLSGHLRFCQRRGNCLGEVAPIKTQELWLRGAFCQGPQLRVHYYVGVRTAEMTICGLHKARPGRPAWLGPHGACAAFFLASGRLLNPRVRQAPKGGQLPCQVRPGQARAEAKNGSFHSACSGRVGGWAVAVVGRGASFMNVGH